MDELNVMLDAGAYPPVSAHESDAGYDLRTPHPVWLEPNTEVTVDTGVHVQIPDGYVGLLLSKSGLMCKFSNITVGGVIDAGYTGSICVQMRNNGKAAKYYSAGDKITQIVFIRHEKPIINIVDSFPKTERGDNGFGSTGQ